MAGWDDQYHLKNPDDSKPSQEGQQEPQPDQQELPQRGGYWRRLGRIWAPFFIKLGISWAVSFIAAMAVMMMVIVAQTGYDSAAIDALTEDEAAVTALTNEAMQRLNEYTVPIEGIAALITIPIMIWMYHRDRIREKMAGIVPAAQARSVFYLLVIVMGAVLCLGLNGLFMIAGLSTDDESYVEAMEAMYSPSLWMQLLCLGVLTPVCEELVYRGLVFKRLREDSSFLMAAVYSTIIFAIMHGYLVEIIYAFAMGMVFCYIYERYGSVKAPIAAHMAANIISVLATYFGWFDWLMVSKPRIGLMIVACAALASTMYVLISRMLSPEDG